MYYEDFMAKYNELPIAYYTSKCAKNELSTKPWTWMLRHLHKEFEVLYIEEGYASISLNKKQFDVHSGDVILIPPFVAHEGDASAEHPFSVYCICFDASILQNFDAKLAKSLLDENSLCCILSPENPITANVVVHLLSIISACQSHTIGWTLAVKGHLMLLFCQMISNFEDKIPRRNNAGCDFCRNVTQFVEENYPSDITSKTISSAFCYSQSYFCRRFKHDFGVCFNEYLNEYRLTTARTLLLEKKYTVTQASVMVGFSSTSYFTQRFQQRFGMLPSEYIK